MTTELISKKEESILKALSWIIIIIGIILRLAQYFDNKSLWFDEARIAVNIIDRSLIELLQPLKYNQGAPLGFLLIEKLITMVFGNSEYALRLYPLFLGIISLFLFYTLAEKCILPRAVPIALGLFSILTSLIYYSTEVKQYSGDVTIAILLFLIALHIERVGISFQNLSLFGIIGAILIWFSHPAIFVLAGIGTTLFFSSFLKRAHEKTYAFIIPFSFFSLSFTFNYFLSLQTLSTHKVLVNYWSSNFMPFSLTLGVPWLYKTISQFFEFLPLAPFVIVILFIGSVNLFKENKKIFFIILSPLFFTLIASALHKYPLWQRLFIFMAPPFILLISCGAEKIRKKLWNYSPLIGVGFLILLFFQPLCAVKQNFIHPQTWDEIKPVIKYVRDHIKEGDAIVIHPGLSAAWKYYSGQFGFEEITKFDVESELGVFKFRIKGLEHILVSGEPKEDSGSDYLGNYLKLVGKKRVWIFLRVSTIDNPNKLKDILNFLSAKGTRLDFFKRPGVEVYLYDLRTYASEGKKCLATGRQPEGTF